MPLPPSGERNPARIAILFSGGVDCTLLARLIHECLPMEQDIDLLNVAFENPRIVRAASRASSTAEDSAHSAFSFCPDRITGLSSHSEILQTCPGRIWRLVLVDVDYSEVQDHRATIVSLMYPHNTEMDLSISSALYFAARGIGTIQNASSGCIVPYTTPSRVLISGLGADELFGGYTRHATAFHRKSYLGLVDELEVDFRRLGKRNLGRDDRIISHWGKEIRYPYLDEDLVDWALSLPVWDKCGFRHAENSVPDHSMLDPAKQLLRILAWKLGLRGAAAEKKRAIQFGARTAKMETGKTKGTQILRGDHSNTAVSGV